MVKMLRQRGLRAVRIAGADASKAGAIPVQASRRAAAILLSASLLTACSTPIEPRIITKEVSVPVTVACVKSDLDLSPIFPDTDAALKATAGPDDMLQLLAAGRLLRVQTMREWAAALLACR